MAAPRWRRGVPHVRLAGDQCVDLIPEHPTGAQSDPGPQRAARRRGDQEAGLTHVQPASNRRRHGREARDELCRASGLDVGEAPPDVVQQEQMDALSFETVVVVQRSASISATYLSPFLAITFSLPAFPSSASPESLERAW
jgi:hypothetical protein